MPRIVAGARLNGGGRVYAYTNPYDEGSLEVHDAATGAALFSIRDPGVDWRKVGGQHPTPVLGSRNNALVTQGERLVSFDLGARTVAWERAGTFRGTPVVAGGMIYVQSDNDVEVRRESDGSLAWIWHMPSHDYPESMFVTDNLLFVSTAATTYAVDLVARQPVWTYPAGGHMTLTKDGVLVIAQADGDLVGAVWNTCMLFFQAALLGG